MNLGSPSGILRSVGIEDKPLKLYGNKLIKEAKKHGFSPAGIKDLPKAVHAPIAIFKRSVDGSHAILTEMQLNGDNVLVSIAVGKGNDIDFNVVSSVYGKNDTGIVNWINNDKLLYADKEKALNYLRISAPIAEAQDNQELISAAKVIKEFENPSIPEENSTQNDENLRFRQIDDDERRQWRDVYDKATTGLGFKFSEAAVDGMESVTRLMKTIADETGMPITEAEDVWGHFNHLSSKNKFEEEYYTMNFFEPITTACRKIGKMGATYTEGKDIIHDNNNILKYIIAKHGLERNEVLAKRDYDAYMQDHPNSKKTLDDFRQRDYSGLSELFDFDKQGIDYEQAAQEYVDNFENNYPTADLWDAINHATDETLRKIYESGLCSKDYYDSVKDMYSFYIPLRNWEIDTADSHYHYKHGNGTGGSLLKRAEGRTSLAANPIAMIGQMGQSAILQANKNMAKRSLYELAMNHDSALLTVRRQWYQNMGTADNPVWERVYPNLREDMTADEVDAEIKDFEKRMRDLKDQGKARNSSKGLQLGYHNTKGQAQQHRINVNIGGREYNIFVNGNPRAAQAINGELRIEDDTNNAVEKVKRWLSQAYTSLNPEFVVSNYERDAGFAASIVAATEPLAYQAGWVKNMTKFNPFTTGAYLTLLIHKVMHGKVDPNNKTEVYMKEFLFNGGETGYTNSLTLDDYKKLVKKNVKKINGAINSDTAKDITIGAIERANRVFEDATRFATYVTSREQGRSVFRSIKDAKEISLNFNTRGADGMAGDGAVYKFFRNLRRYWIFVNPSIQGLAKATRAFKQHPVRSLISVAGVPTLLGFSMATIAGAILGGDGDDDEAQNAYKDLPKWVRRTNICIPLGGTKFATIPLSYELRVAYGLGEMMWEMQEGMIDKDEMAMETVMQLSDLLPVSFMSGTPAQNVSPSFFRPVMEVIQNSDFQGKKIYKDNTFNPYAPEYTQCYAGTAKWLTKSMEVLNTATGGDKYTKEWLEKGADRIHLGKAFNPGVIEHLLNSYAGGLFTFPNKTYKFYQGFINGDEDYKDIRNIPILSRNFRDSRSGNPNSKGLGSRYYDYMEDYRETKSRYDGYRRETRHGVTEFVPKLTNFLNTPEGQRMQLVDEYKRKFDKKDKRIKDIDRYGGDKAERNRLKRESDQLKQEMVEKLGSISGK